MDGRFVVAFVALTIMAEINRELGKPHNYTDLRRKPIPAHYYSFRDIINLTTGITMNYGYLSEKFWLNGVHSDIERICLACGLPHAYEQVPAFITDPGDLCMT